MRVRNPISYNPSTSAWGYDGDLLDAQGLGDPPRLFCEPDSFFTDRQYEDFVSWSRKLALESWPVKAGVDIKSVYSVGDSLRARSLAGSLESRAVYDEYIAAFYKRADVKGTNLNSLLHQISYLVDVDGDCFVLLTQDSVTERPKIQLILANRVWGNPPSGSRFANNRLYKTSRGIVTDGRGVEVAYIVDGVVVVQADQMLHVKDSDPLSGSRGMPLFAHAIRTMLQVDEIQLAELHASKIAASIALTVTNEDGEGTFNTSGGNDSTPEQEEGVTATSLPLTETRNWKTGLIHFLNGKAGEKIETLRFERPSPNYQSFEQRLVDGALIGAGIPHELVNPKNATGTIMRASLNIFDRVCKDRSQLLAELVEDLMAYVLSYGINREQLPAEIDYMEVHVSRPPKPSIDLGRDATVALAEYNAGIRTIDSYARDAGLTDDEFIAKVARDRAKMALALKEEYENLGLEPPSNTTNPQMN